MKHSTQRLAINALVSQLKDIEYHISNVKQYLSALKLDDKYSIAWRKTYKNKISSLTEKKKQIEAAIVELQRHICIDEQPKNSSKGIYAPSKTSLNTEKIDLAKDPEKVFTIKINDIVSVNGFDMNVRELETGSIYLFATETPEFPSVVCNFFFNQARNTVYVRRIGETSAVFTRKELFEVLQNKTFVIN